MESLTIAEILSATKGKLLCGNNDTVITSISTNSRNLKDNSLFIPIIGETFDAHKFIDKAFENSAVATLTSDQYICNNKKNWILVKDTKGALQNIAEYYRSKFNIPVIGVTGSVGKTTCKEMIAAALSKKNVLKTIGNNNSQIGVPLTIFRLEHSHDFAVIEMGISEPDEMARIAKVAKPCYAVITNIGMSHIGNLRSKENILSEKLHIADYIKTDGKLYINGDDEPLKNSINTFEYNPVTFGFSQNLDFTADDIKFNNGYSEFLLNSKNHGKYKFKIPVTGKHNILNAIAAVSIALNLDLDPKDIQEGLNSYRVLSMRQDIKEVNSITIIDDSYNASPDSVKSGLSTLRDIKNTGNKIAVLADMLELGEYSKQAHFNIGKALAEFGVNYLITIGEESMQIAHGAKISDKNIQIFSFDNNTDATNCLRNILKHGDAVLIKGSRGMKTDEIVKSIV